jgi:hypothetical protein
MAQPHDIVDRLDAAADAVPEDLSGLLLDAADELRHLRDLLSIVAGMELEDAKPQGRAWTSLGRLRIAGSGSLL